MKILLDTQVFLWLLNDAPELSKSKKATKLFLDAKNDFFISLASLWEIAIKISIGKMTLHQPFEKFIPHQLQENSISQLNINFRHVSKVISLPFHHRDPFDRIIIAQGLEEHLPILSSDEIFEDYGVNRLW